MRFPGKKRREAIAATRKDIDFEHYSWKEEKYRGWHPMVVLNAQDKETTKGDPMTVVDFGIDNPDGTGARIRFRAPVTFPPKVQMLMEVLLPEYLDSEDDVDVDPKVMMFRTCVGLIDIDETFQRDDGEPSWELVKIIKTEDAEAELGEGWQSGSAESEDAGDSDDGDVF